MIALLIAPLVVSVASMPQEKLGFSDGGVRVTIQYRERTDQTGFPRASSGILIVRSAAHDRTYDLARIFPIGEHRVQFFTVGGSGCGAMRPAMRSGRFFAISYIWAEKGCRADAAFIDLDSGRVADAASVDHRYDHRLDVVPVRFVVQERLRVVSVTRVVLAGARFSPNSEVAQYAPWPFALVEGLDSQGRIQLYAFEIPQQSFQPAPDPGRYVLPKPGSYVEVGALSRNDWLLDYHPESLILRFSEADDLRYARMQAPDSPAFVRRVQRNEWFEVMVEEAQEARLTSALHALSKVVDDDRGTSMFTEDRAYYENCKELVGEVHSGKVSASAAASVWDNQGCRITATPR